MTTDDDRTQYHIERAEYLLSMAGEPKTPDQIFSAAAASSMLAMVGQMRQGITVSKGVLSVEEGLAEWEKELLLGNVGNTAIDPNTMTAWANLSGTSDITHLILAMRHVDVKVPAWESRKIMAIKELRQHLSCGLKEAKDLIEAVTDRRANGYADFW